MEEGDEIELNMSGQTIEYTAALRWVVRAGLSVLQQQCCVTEIDKHGYRKVLGLRWIDVPTETDGVDS